MESNPFDYGPNRHEEAKLQAERDMRRDQIRAIIPTISGVARCFDAHGYSFIVKKSNHNTWSLWRAGDIRVYDRVRFGTMSQIQEDISYVLDNGVLPPRKGTAP